MSHFSSVGVDTHKNSNSVFAIDYISGETHYVKLNSDPNEIVKWLNDKRLSTPIKIVYETGPTGFTLSRALCSKGLECFPIAVSKLPRKIDRQKNDKIDAEFLARQLLAGQFSRVYVPSEEMESYASLSRLRWSYSKQLSQAKQRISSFLLNSGTTYTETKSLWTLTFCSWCHKYKFEQHANTLKLQELINSVEGIQNSLARVDDALMHIIRSNPSFFESYNRLTCIHGVGKIVAISFILELYNFERFKRSKDLASYLGLVPSEHSTGQKCCRGGITKTGNKHLRTLIIQSAQAYTRPHNNINHGGSFDLVNPEVQMAAIRYRDRLYRLKFNLEQKGKPSNVAKVAVARELAEHMLHIVKM